ncbi:MAG: O-antigen ligase family protein, partial [Candidatus Aminicenantaceae bacterium]
VELWGSALHMGVSYPITGVGIGAFIIEYPNSISLQNITHRHTDSAENYILQVFSELGVTGVIVISWIFIAILSSLKVGKGRGNDRTEPHWIRVGLIAAIGAVFTNFLFHSYIGAFDAKYFVWLLMGLAVVFCTGPPKISEGGRSSSMFFKRAWLLGVLVFALLHLWNSTHSLSLSNTTVRFELGQSFGLYPAEIDGEGHTFNWARKRAGLTFGKEEAGSMLPIRASHPGIERHPVHVTLYTADPAFKNKVKHQEVRLMSTDWHFLRLPDLLDSGKRIHIYIETDREWQPSKYSESIDSRRLAVAIGAIKVQDREK